MTRETRADEVRRERRFKPGDLQASGIKLQVDMSKLDTNTFTYRFANDRPDRIRGLEARDWDIAPEFAKADTNSGGTVNSAVAGFDEGRPYNTVLMRKYRDWFDADQKRKMEPLDEIDRAIARGAEHAGQQLTGAGVYTPGQNLIERVGR